MTAVLIALADVGPSVELEEQLTRHGLAATWSQQLANGPQPGHGTPTVVIVDADHLGGRLTAVVEAWREQPSVPGVVAIGQSADARTHAPKARVTLVAPTAKIATLIAAIQEAEKLRLAGGMRWPVLRAALALPPTDDQRAAWHLTLTAARAADPELARNALRWHVQHYVTPTTRLDELREDRSLSVPELELVGQLDGTLTVQSAVRLGPMEAPATARLLWTLGCMRALDFTPEVRDVATPARRMLSDVRAHLRARTARLERSTYYDVLEITPLAEYEEIEHAYQLVASRFGPEAIEHFDLADVAPLVKPIWELVEKSRSVLVDHAQRGRYHDWLRQKLAELKTVWAIDPQAITAGAEFYRRGQLALSEGDVHKAMSDLAAACRQVPGHPEYESYLAWARYRVQVAAGRDRSECARVERTQLEGLLYGCKPWPRALVALALICAAGGDADTARWHLHTALTVDPNLPAAVQLAQRLGMRR